MVCWPRALPKSDKGGEFFIHYPVLVPVAGYRFRRCSPRKKVEQGSRISRFFSLADHRVDLNFYNGMSSMRETQLWMRISCCSIRLGIFIVIPGTWPYRLFQTPARKVQTGSTGAGMRHVPESPKLASFYFLTPLTYQCQHLPILYFPVLLTPYWSIAMYSLWTKASMPVRSRATSSTS